MAKKRVNIGSVVKTKSGTKAIKVSQDVKINLSKGQYINLESKDEAIASLHKALESGRMKQETFEKLLASVEKTPDWVISNVYVLVED